MTAALTSKRVAIYARYSSHQQSERSIEDQVRRCADYVRAAGGEVDDALVFTDLAVSAASTKRPGFERMMFAVDERQVDTIVAEDLSRVTRDLADAAAIFKRLQYLGVPLIGVADGVDTGAKSAKLTYTIKSLVADIYLDDLKDKTRRGLIGRCRAGYSTGGLPIGYRTEAAVDASGREAGRRIVVDDAAANIVRRVFALYIDGLSYGAIARKFNAEGVPCARLHTKHRHKGWISSSVRAILSNRAYIGEWTYNKREWRKLPGTNVRRPRKRDTNEIIVQTFPQRRIVDSELWEQARARAAGVAARYGDKRAKPGVPGHRTRYPLSGLLLCGKCGAPMTICGTSAAYYSCGDARKRGTCTNRLTVREEAARSAILGAIRAALFTPDAIAFLRRRIAERLRNASASGAAEINMLAERLRRNEDRIGGLVRFIADGDHSQYIRDTLRDLEAQVRADAGVIEALRASRREPARLPSPDDLLDRARDLRSVIASDPVRGREALRGVLQDGKVVMHPQADGSYVAEFGFVPLAAVGERQGRGSQEQPEVTPMIVPIPKPPDRRRVR